jgi:hypothetical protein
MTDWSMQSTERDLNQMLGDFLSRRSVSAKDLARRVGCDPRTAEGFRAGRHWPQAKHWLGLVAAFGTDITEAVFHPDRAAARLQEEIAALEAKLAEQRAALRVVAEGERSFAPRTAQARARDEDRAAAVTAGD